MSKRIPTGYPGVYYRFSKRIGGKGDEKVFYITYKKNGKLIEEKAGRQFADQMTPARASGYRSLLIEGKTLSRKEERRQEVERKKITEEKYTIDRLWKNYKANRASGKSLQADEYRYDKYLKPEYGEKEPSDIIRLDVERLKRRLSKNLAPQTVKHILDLLTWIINYGVNNGLCQGLKFRIPKPTVNNQKTEDLSEEQIKKLLQSIEGAPDIQVANLMKLALFTGMRRGELFKLKWEDIDLKRGFITIQDPKGGKDAVIPINDPASKLLESHPRTRSPYVFPKKNGEMRTEITREVNKIKEEAGLPEDFRPLHGLRHTYASMLASSGKVDMYTLQKLLTHKSPIMTQRYAHLRDETLKKAGDVASDLFNAIDEGNSDGNTVGAQPKNK